MKTYSAKSQDIERAWHLVDATDKPLGRLASEVAKRLRGKHKPQYTSHVDVGDHIVVVNADKVMVTGNKRENKIYYRHSGYVGNLKQTTFREAIEKYPEKVIERAVRGMLPRTILGRQMFRKLHVYAGATHKNQAQKPQLLDILAK